jgi:hypothetical protein
MKTIVITLLMIVAIATPSLAKKTKTASQTQITIQSGRIEATINTKSVNPIVVSRDRALSN